MKGRNWIQKFWLLWKRVKIPTINSKVSDDDFNFLRTRGQIYIQGTSHWGSSTLQSTSSFVAVPSQDDKIHMSLLPGTWQPATFPKEWVHPEYLSRWPILSFPSLRLQDVYYLDYGNANIECMPMSKLTKYYALIMCSFYRPIITSIKLGGGGLWNF